MTLSVAAQARFLAILGGLVVLLTLFEKTVLSWKIMRARVWPFWFGARSGL